MKQSIKPNRLPEAWGSTFALWGGSFILALFLFTLANQVTWAG